MEREYYCTYTDPQVHTASGNVHGYCFDGVYTFLGIPYGKAKRFMQPEAPDAWNGLIDTIVPGFNCPAIGHSQAIDGFPHNFWLENEDCLNLNVWTPSIAEGDKKPVLVWLHGGGFAYGAPLRQPAYEGMSLAKTGDTVVVSITSRLNIFGFLDLSEYGDNYKNSGNAGVADLVLGMKWIHENISRFGGDPGNVTICGQSGGGGKVIALMQCPQADGTFQKALIMSGVGFQSLKSNGTREAAKAMLEKLNASGDISALEKLSTVEFIELFKTVQRDLKKDGINVSFGPINNGYSNSKQFW